MIEVLDATKVARIIHQRATKMLQCLVWRCGVAGRAPTHHGERQIKSHHGQKAPPGSDHHRKLRHIARPIHEGHPESDTRTSEKGESAAPSSMQEKLI